MTSIQLSGIGPRTERDGARLVSYVLDLDLPVETWEEAEQLAAATSTPGLLPLRVAKRRGWFRARRPGVYPDWDAGQAVLDDAASWEEDAFSLSPDGGEALARTVLKLGLIVPPGWTLRSYWVGDPVEAKETVSPHALAELIRSSALRRTTLYRIS